jgi:hypothetical protein
MASPYNRQDGDATGYSVANSFDEAFIDALAHLQPKGAPHPDEIVRVQVVEIGSESGGFAGGSRLYVTVRREQPS